MILYRAQDSFGNGLASSTDTDVDIKTLPRKAKRDLINRIGVQQKKVQPRIFTELEHAATDSRAESSTRFQQQSATDSRAESSISLQPLPEERVAEDPNADPDEIDIDLDIDQGLSLIHI